MRMRLAKELIIGLVCKLPKKEALPKPSLSDLYNQKTPAETNGEH